MRSPSVLRPPCLINFTGKKERWCNDEGIGSSKEGDIAEMGREWEARPGWDQSSDGRWGRARYGCADVGAGGCNAEQWFIFLMSFLFLFLYLPGRRDGFLTHCPQWKNSAFSFKIQLLKSRAKASLKAECFWFVRAGLVETEKFGLFTIAKTWKQPKCPSTDEWIKQMQSIYTMEYYSAIKKN